MMDRRPWPKYARARLIAALALALAFTAVWATRASSASPSAGQLYTFGSNLSGALGPNRPGNDPNPGPVALPAGAGAATRVALGADADLTIGSDGRLYTFGDNSLGQLGRPTSDLSSPTPAAVTLPGSSSSVVDAAGGDQFSAAVTSAGQVYVFGDNSYGQHGDGTSGAGSATPVQATVPASVGQVTAVSAGEDHVLALTSADDLLAWGHNEVGQVGTPTSYATDTPITTPSVEPFLGDHAGTFTQIGAGDGFSVVLTDAGQVFTFGANGGGQLGRTIGANSDYHPGLVSFPGLSGRIVQIAVGAAHTLALSSSGQLYAFGENTYGQLGNTGGNSATPELVTLPAGAGPIVHIAATGADSFALTDSGQLYGFGNNHYGQLGPDPNIGTDTPNPIPTAVAMPGGVSLDTVAGGFSNQSAVIIAALAVTSTTLPTATTGTAYSASASASGGRPGYRWTAAGLPPGLGISDAGAITGTPTTAGSYTPMLTVTDSDGISASVRAVLDVASPATSTSTTTTTTHPPPAHRPRVQVSPPVVAGARATLTVKCAGATGQRCAGAITGTTVEHLVGGKLVSITAAATPATAGTTKKKTTTRKLRVVSRRYTVKAGRTVHLALALSRAGRRLLNARYAVPVRLSIANGAVRANRTVTFRYTVIDAPVSYFWNFFIPYTVVGNLSADRLRASWHVTLTCRGAGCPVKRATLKIHRGTASATGVLKGAHLRVGTIVQIIISAPNAVAEVVRFQVLSNRLPRTTSLCQTPGQRAPHACHA